MMKKTAFLLSLVLAFALSMCACSMPDPADYGTLWVSDIAIEVGASKDLETSFSKAEYDNLAITYSFDSSAIAIVGNRVTGMSAGAVMVTAKTQYHQSQFRVTVTNPGAVDYGTLQVANITLTQTETETATPLFSKNEYVSAVTYTTQNTDIIAISGNQITGLKAGTATVTATTAHHSATFTVTVNPFDYGELEIANISLKTTESANINPVFTHSEYSNLTISYSYDQSKITIANGVVTAKEVTGAVAVTASTTYHTETFNVYITAKNWGTLSIESVVVPYSEISDGTGFGSANEGGFYAEVTPVFSIPENAEEITYAFDTAKLRREGNKFYPLSASKNTVVSVTARTAHLVTTFNIDVKAEENYCPYAEMDDREKVVKAKMDKFDADNSFNKNDMTIFLGDSYFDTNSFCKDFYTTRFPNQNVYTFNASASCAFHWQWYIQHVYKYNPKNIVLHMGINDQNYMHSKEPYTVVKSLKNVLNGIHKNLPNTKIYMYTVECIVDGGLLTSDASYNFRDASNVILINTEMKKWNEENPWFTILDSYKVSHEDPKNFFGIASWDNTKVDETHPGWSGYNKMFALAFDAGLCFSYKPGYTTALKTYNYASGATEITDTALDFSALNDGATKNYVFEADIKLTSYSGTNGHINFSIAGDNHRFLIWDKHASGSADSGNKFLYQAICSTYSPFAGFKNTERFVAQGISKTDLMNKGIKVAVLTTSKSSYLFVNNVLQCAFINNPSNSVFRFGVFECTATVSNAKFDIATSGYGLYSSYVTRAEVQQYENCGVEEFNFVYDLAK